MNVSSVALSIKMAATATGESPLSNLAANLTLSPFALKDIVTASFLTTAILFAAAPDIIPYEPELSKYFSGVNVAYLKPRIGFCLAYLQARIFIPQFRSV